MQWEQLTAPEFERAVQETGGVCVVALGVLERHSDHLPLGTDALVGHRVCCLAAEKEPAVVFPMFYFGQIYEARCFPGTLTVRPTLLLELIEGVFDEIGRNGFTKIVIHNAHGGNWHLAQFFAQAALWAEKPYTIYVQSQWLTEDRKPKWNEVLTTKEHGHACECETSMCMALFPDLVRAGAIPRNPATSLKRLAHLPPARLGIGWYAMYPDHYAGDARAATPEKGRVLVDLVVDSLAEFIRAVKADETAPALEKEFFEHTRSVGKHAASQRADKRASRPRPRKAKASKNPAKKRKGTGGASQQVQQ